MQYNNIAETVAEEVMENCVCVEKFVTVRWISCFFNYK